MSCFTNVYLASLLKDNKLCKQEQKKTWLIFTPAGELRFIQKQQGKKEIETGKKRGSKKKREGVYI